MVYNAANLTWTDINLLRDHHRVSIEAYIMDASRRHLFDVSKQMVSGVVDIDTEGEVSRFGKMSILDPYQRVSMDLNGAAWGTGISNRMIQIIYRVNNMDLNYSYGCPIFTGPITKADRDGVMLDLEFKGQEILLLGGNTVDYTFPAGNFRSQILMWAAQIWGGIYTFVDNMNGGITSAPFVIGQEDTAWERMKDLATSYGAHLFFDGNGFMRIEPMNQDVKMLINETWLTEEPKYNLDASKLRNVVRVEGAVAPGTETRMFYEAWPPPEHPYSPQSLARNGSLRVIPLVIKDESLTDWFTIANAAWNNLANNMLSTETVTAVTPVIPFLEEYDTILFAHPKMYARAPLTKATIPLVGDGEMTINTFSTTSTGDAKGPGWSFISNIDSFGSAGPAPAAGGGGGKRNRLGPKHIALTHSFHPAIKNKHHRGEDWYTGPNGGPGAPSKGGKKKNRNKGKGKGKR